MSVISSLTFENNPEAGFFLDEKCSSGLDTDISGFYDVKSRLDIKKNYLDVIYSVIYLYILELF